MNPLTPIEEYECAEGKILLKRDDKFILKHTNGGKLRQALALIKKNKEIIENEHHGVVVCPCSNPSPQSAIISEVCSLYGFKCKIVTFKTDKPNINLSIAQSYGSELFGTNVGWNSVIEAKAKQLKGFNIKMGFGNEDIIDANMGQVENIPNELDYLVIPCGSAFNAISIIKGLEKYNKKVDRVILVQIGKDPTSTLETYLKAKSNYTLVRSPLSYSTSLTKYPLFDEIYEAKAFDWIVKNLDLKNKKVLFWVVGKRNTNFEPTKLRWNLI